jgi:colicin import membrane protein
MNAHSTSAYSLSLMLHGAFVAAMLLTAFALKDETSRKSTEIFELVAGAGDNWAATEAPAEGTPDGVKFQAPSRQPAAPAPEPVAPPQPEPVNAPAAVAEPSPLTPAPVEAVAPPKVEPKKAPPQKTLAQQVAQIADRKEKTLLTKHWREEAARAKKEAAEEAKRKATEAAAAKKAKMTLEEFQRLNGKKTAANTKTRTSSYEPISTQGITNGVSDGTTSQPGAGSKALSRAEQDRLGTYFALLKQKLLAAHEKPLGVSDQLTARVSFHIAASGALRQAKIVKSSGNAEYDRSVLATFRAVNSIGPRPDDQGDTREVTFDMRDID